MFAAFLFAGGDVAFPGFVQLLQDLLGDLGGQCPVGLVGLHEFVQLVVGEPLPPEDEGLAHLVEGSVVEVLRFEGGLIDHGIAGIAAPDYVLFGELHRVAFLSLKIAFCSYSFAECCFPALNDVAKCTRAVRKTGEQERFGISESSQHTLFREHDAQG